MHGQESEKNDDKREVSGLSGKPLTTNLLIESDLAGGTIIPFQNKYLNQIINFQANSSQRLPLSARIPVLHVIIMDPGIPGNESSSGKKTADDTKKIARAAADG